MLLDPRAHHEIFDDNVTVTVARGDGSLTVYGVVATIGQLTSREIMLNGPVGLQPDDKVLVLYAESLEGLEPKPGDVVTDAAGVAWGMVSVSCAQYGGLPVSYRAIMRKRL